MGNKLAFYKEEKQKVTFHIFYLFQFFLLDIKSIHSKHGHYYCNWE